MPSVSTGVEDATQLYQFPKIRGSAALGLKQISVTRSAMGELEIWQYMLAASKSLATVVNVLGREMSKAAATKCVS